MSMTEANEMRENAMLGLNNVVSGDTGDTIDFRGGQSFFCQEETASDEIPLSLLNYFKTSKSRAAVCEKLIFEDLEDFTALNFPTELSEDENLKEQVFCETENEENQTDGDLNDEDEAGTDEYVETGHDLASKSSEYKAERKKRHSEEIQQEEQRKQRETDFQEELRRIIEAEKVQQRELELMEKRAQEKLEQELLLQQELISNLQKQVEQEKKRIEEEQKRKKEEEQRKMREEEERRKKEEEDERKRKEMEERRKREEEEERKRKEREEKRKKEEEDERKRKEMEERRKRKEEEERKRKEMEERRKGEEEEERKRKEMEEKRKKEEEDERKRKEMEERRKKEEEDEKKREEEEERERKEIEKRRMDEEEERNNVELRFKEEDRRKKENVKMNLEEQERKKVGEKNMKEMQIKGEEDKKNTIDAGKTTGDETNEKEIKLKDELMKPKEEEMRNEDKRPEEKVQVKMKQEKRKSKEESEEGEVGKKMPDEQKKSNEKENRTNGVKIQLNERELKRKKHEDKRLIMENTNKNEGQIEEEYRNPEKEKEGPKKEMEGKKSDDERRTRDKDKTKEEVKKHQDDGSEKKEDREENRDTKGEEELMMTMNRLQKKNKEKTISTEHLKQGHSSACDTLPTSIHSSCGTAQKQEASTIKTTDGRDPAVTVWSSPVCLPEHTEQKRLSWMKDCISWSKLSLQNRRRQRQAVRSRRGLRRTADTTCPPPLCPDALLQATGWKTLQEVTTVTLEDLPGCSLSTLAQCPRLQSLTLRRCGLKSLEGISQLEELCYIDLQENDISFVDCENMKSLRVLRLSHNKLTSIRGLSGADNLNVLELSHNSISRIAGLESLIRLQRLSMDHNQLISTKGLRDVFTLLHLDCSHNHLGSVEGLENNALLHTLDLTANSLTEPPGLNNQVLLRELHLDDNSIASLQGLTACWLPLMQHLTVSQNRIVQLPSMSDFVSLENLDLRFNCLSELQNMCENLEGCQFLRDVHLTGNPLQKENGWRSTLQKALPGLRAIDSLQTDSFLSPPAVEQVSLASGAFLTFCQAQIRQTRDLQLRHGGDLSDAPSPLDAVKSLCRHLTMSLELAEEQRFAHEYGDTAVSDRHRAADESTPETALDVELTYYPEMESTNKTAAVSRSGDNMTCCDQSFERRPTAETGPTPERKTTPFSLEKAPVSSCGVLHLKNKAAVMIQQQWRKYKQKCGNTNAAPSIAKKGGERGGDGSKPESGSSYINRRVSGQDYAATVIQAFWRGFTLRRRLASALAAVTQPDAEEEDTLEEVDVDEFAFDEADIEKRWTLTLPEDPTPRCYSVSQQPLSLKDPSHYILPPLRLLSPVQAWVAGEQVGSTVPRNSPESFRSKSPASTSVFRGCSEKAEKIMEEWGFTDSHTALLMLKRAQKMKSGKQQEKKLRDPAVRPALFRLCNYPRGPVEARNRLTPNHRNDGKDGEATRAVQQAGETEQMKVKQWLQPQSAESERRTESERFLPEISSYVLNGGRVQLMADPAYTDRLHQASGSWANNSSAVQPCKPSSYPRRNSLGYAKKEPPSPKRVVSAPSKKERISFRDNPIKLSGGWGGGKKRDRVHK